MTDQSESRLAPATPKALPLWTERKAKVVLAAAWTVLGMTGLAVMAGALWIAGSALGDSVLDGVPYRHEAVLPAAATIAMNFLFWGLVVMISIGMGSITDDEIDYSEVQVTPISVRAFGLAIVLMVGLASVPLAEQSGVHAAVALAGPIAMQFGGITINAILGPHIQRRCPELWASALARRPSGGGEMVWTRKPRTVQAVLTILALIVMTAAFVIRTAYFG